MEKLNLVIFTDNESESELCKNYWRLNTDFRFDTNVKSLAQLAELSQKQFLEFVNDQCDAQSTEIFCQDCENPFIYQTRNDFLEKQRRLDWYIDDWLCADCESERRRLKEQREIAAVNNYRQLIRQRYSSEPAEVNLEDLSLEDAVYLLSFIRFCADEELSLAKPLGSLNFHSSLSPQINNDYEILRRLYKQGIIKVNPESPTNAFTGEMAETFYLDKVLWILPVSPNSEHPKHLVKELEEIFRLNNFPSNWLDETLLLWKKIALQECLQYLENSLTEHNLELSPGEKTILVINTLLEDFSVGQIYNIIWRAAKDAAAFSVRKSVSKQHAANTVVGYMQRYGENAKIQGWEIKPFRRHFDCPQSMISQVFFDSVLKIGEAGFNQVPYSLGFEEMSDINEIDEIQ